MGYAGLSLVAAFPSKACSQRIGVNLCATYGHFQGIRGSIRRNVSNVDSQRWGKLRDFKGPDPRG